MKKNNIGTDTKVFFVKEKRKEKKKERKKERKRERREKEEKRDEKVNVLQISACCRKSIGRRIRDLGSSPSWLLMNHKSTLLTSSKLASKESGQWLYEL